MTVEVRSGIRATLDALFKAGRPASAVLASGPANAGAPQSALPAQAGVGPKAPAAEAVDWTAIVDAQNARLPAGREASQGSAPVLPTASVPALARLQVVEGNNAGRVGHGWDEIVAAQNDELRAQIAASANTGGAVEAQPAKSSGHIDWAAIAAEHNARAGITTCKDASRS